MLQSFPFSKQQQTVLEETYWNFYYGTNTFQRIKYIISQFEKCNHLNTADWSFPECNTTYNNESNFLCGSQSILNAITYLLSRNSTISSSVYTNFPYTQNKIDKLFYSFVLKNQTLCLKHMICFNNSTNNTYTLGNIFHSIKYATRGINTLILSENNFSLPSVGIFPYFVVSETGTLLYDENIENGLLLLDSSINQKMMNYCNNLTEKCRPLAIFPKNAFELKSWLSSNTPINIGSCIGAEPCLTTLLTKDILYSIVNSALPDKDFIIESFSSWLKTSASPSDKILNFNSKKGFEYFMKTGKISHFPAEYSNALSPNQREQVLKKCMDNINNHEIIYYLIDDEHISLPDNINIELHSSDTIIIYGNFQENSSYLGEFIIPIKNHRIYNDFINLEDYFLKNRLYLDSQHQMLFFQDLLLRLKNS